MITLCSIAVSGPHPAVLVTPLASTSGACLFLEPALCPGKSDSTNLLVQPESLHSLSTTRFPSENGVQRVGGRRQRRSPPGWTRGQGAYCHD